MNEAAEKITANADYVGILCALDWLATKGLITPEESKKTALHIATKLGTSILII